MQKSATIRSYMQVSCNHAFSNPKLIHTFVPSECPEYLNPTSPVVPLPSWACIQLQLAVSLHTCVHLMLLSSFLEWFALIVLLLPCFFHSCPFHDPRTTLAHPCAKGRQPRQARMMRRDSFLCHAPVKPSTRSQRYRSYGLRRALGSV